MKKEGIPNLFFVGFFSPFILSLLHLLTGVHIVLPIFVLSKLHIRRDL